LKIRGLGARNARKYSAANRSEARGRRMRSINESGQADGLRRDLRCCADAQDVEACLATAAFNGFIR
jgi:hypothetical protein